MPRCLGVAALLVLVTSITPCVTNAAAGPTSAAAGHPAAYVSPVSLRGLQQRLATLPSDEQRLIRSYIEAARREVLKPEDGCFPVTPPAIGPRNWAERAKGAAVLSSFEGYWPEDLRRQCRDKARDLVREVAMTHRAKPSFDYEWQAAFWASEAAIAAWFMWDELDADLRDAVAEMVIFQADRFIDKSPKMGFQGNTEAETVSWNSSILTLAVNMMPDHPHRPKWDEAAKRYVYNTFAVPQDAEKSEPGDDGRRVRDWIAGANLHPDFVLENHGQFHIDYVLACYRFHIQGAAMYGLAGRPLPQAFRHHALDVYEQILLRCMDGEGFFVYVSDNDWKRYHPWAESCSIHAYIAMLEQHPLAAALERRALRNASAHWQAMPEDFAFDNPYVCGKPWTSRIADVVLLHLTWPRGFPAPLPKTEIDSRLASTSRVETADLLSHYSKTGSLTSWCKGKADSRIRFIAPAKDAWMLLPLAGNYEPHVAGKPLLGKCEALWKREADWFWIVRRDEAGRAEAFISLPDSTAIYAHFLPATTLGPSEEIVNSIAIEKPYSRTSLFVEGGQAAYSPGQDQWQFQGDARAIAGNWVNLQDRMGWVVRNPGSQAGPMIRLPEPGKRGRLDFVSHAASGDHVLFIFALPDQTHADTRAASDELQCWREKTGAVFSCRTARFSLTVKMGSEPNVTLNDRDRRGRDGK